MKAKKQQAGYYTKLSNPLYIRLQAGFTGWLRTLNFAPQSQKFLPKMLTEFLAFLEARNCPAMEDIQEKHLLAYVNYLSLRPNQKRGGGLSLNTIRTQLQAIRKFSSYLSQTGQQSFQVTIRWKDRSPNAKNVLSKTSINRLYQSTTESPLGLRDRALLALYYGCGLRKNEGIALNVADILLEKELLYVRKGKGYKERYVPLTGSHKTDLENYLAYARPYLAGQDKQALLLSCSGNRLSGVSAYRRLQQLRKTAGIDQAVGLHTLRHSIATHLLQSGMKLHQIQLFLGHTSMESTQIYTHILHEEETTLE